MFSNYVMIDIVPRMTNEWNGYEYASAVFKREAQIKQCRCLPPILAPLLEEPEPLAVSADMDPQLWGDLQHHISLYEKVFVKLPFREFFQARVVCKEWNRLASDGNFLEQNARPPISKPYFCLMHPQGDWQIILTYNAAADEWRQMSLPLPYKRYARANWVDGFLHISWPEYMDTGRMGSVKHVVLNLRTRMQYILPPYIEECFVKSLCVDSLLVNKCQGTFQVVSSATSSLHNDRYTSIYCSKSKSWKSCNGQTSLPWSNTRLTRKPSFTRKTSFNASSSICCRNILYTYFPGWSFIMLYDITLGSWNYLSLPQNTECCHLGLWQDTVYAVTSYKPSLPEEYRCVRVLVLCQQEAKWEEVAGIPPDLCGHMFHVKHTDVAAVGKLADVLVEASFCEQYVHIAAFVQDYHVLNQENASLWVPGSWVPRRFCLYNLATREWRHVNRPCETDREIKIEAFI